MADEKKQILETYFNSLKFFEANILVFSIGGIITSALSTAYYRSTTADASIAIFFIQGIPCLIFFILSYIMTDAERFDIKDTRSFSITRLVIHSGLIIIMFSVSIALFVYPWTVNTTSTAATTYSVVTSTSTKSIYTNSTSTMITNIQTSYYTSAGSFAFMSFAFNLATLIIEVMFWTLDKHLLFNEYCC